MICPTDPPQKNQKNPEKIPSKGYPRARTLVEFKEIFFQISFSQYANNVGTPLFRSMRQAQNTDTMHSISWGCPQIVRHFDPISLLIITFGIHLEPGYKSHEQSFIVALLEMSQNKRQFCPIFR